VSVPGFGPLSLSGFAHPWSLLLLALVMALLVGYVVVIRRRARRPLRFANMAVLESVAPTRRRRLRHLPAALTVIALALLVLAIAAPTAEARVPRTRAVVMLVIDVSESMVATDVEPNRLAAAKAAGQRFADELTPGINLGLIEFAGNATVLAPPTTDRAKVKSAIDGLQVEERTATGEGIFTALQSIAATDAVLGGGDGPPPARIVLESDGAETVPSNPEAPRGAFTAAHAAHDQGVSISTVSFGTKAGVVDLNGQSVPVPVDDSTLQKITEISGGTAYHAASQSELENVYATLQDTIGYTTVPSDASLGWMRFGAFALAAAVVTAVLFNRRLTS
jgi:Ca-activated chloride channel homolog